MTMTPWKAYYYLGEIPIDVPDSVRVAQSWWARNAAIWRLRQQGMTYRAIGELFGLGPERIRQILISKERHRAAGRVEGPLELWLNRWTWPDLLTDTFYLPTASFGFSERYLKKEMLRRFSLEVRHDLSSAAAAAGQAPAPVDDGEDGIGDLVLDDGRRTRWVRRHIRKSARHDG